VVLELDRARECETSLHQNHALRRPRRSFRRDGVEGKQVARVDAERVTPDRDGDRAVEPRGHVARDRRACSLAPEAAHVEAGDANAGEHRVAVRDRATAGECVPGEDEHADEDDRDATRSEALRVGPVRLRVALGSVTIIDGMGTGERLRGLPSVDALVDGPRLSALVERHGRDAVVRSARAALARAREEIQAGYAVDDVPARVAAELERSLAPRLRRALNATGVIVHTNLGRAPLAHAALERVADVGRGYSNLEYDLEAGSRGSRQDHVAGALRDLTGAEAALVVNNNAAAVLLALAALADGRQAIVSRGELVEIGDGFRIPDVLARSGAELVEVGTTNRTRLADYERAIGDRTAVLLRVHPSNFRIVGFTEEPPLRELARLAERHGLVLVHDLGSGILEPLADEPSARESLAAGAHLVLFSGDKLLGGPQAGIVVGRADLVERLRRHPLQRALRADKLTLAALEGTLAAYRADRSSIPVLGMLEQSLEGVRARAERLAALTGGSVERTLARVGGGALPLAELESYACALPEELARPLRVGEPPVVGVVRGGRLLLDCRTLTQAEVEEAARAVAACR
jgi:L-seryl-tRNA(Ser) seleniumtransferase